MPIEEFVLVDAARAARRFAVAPFSHFAVGAALETAEGVVVTGCNVENATYGLTVCAERIALFKALSEGHRTFTRVVVVAGTENPTPPCGACRQVIAEHLARAAPIVVDGLGVFTSGDLLPHAFQLSV